MSGDTLIRAAWVGHWSSECDCWVNSSQGVRTWRGKGEWGNPLGIPLIPGVEEYNIIHIGGDIMVHVRIYNVMTCLFQPLKV